MAEKDPRIREAGIKWYCGSFPGKPDILELRIGRAAYQMHKARLETGMNLESWTGGIRRRTSESLKAFVEGLEQPQIAGLKRRKEEEEGEGRRTRKRVG